MRKFARRTVEKENKGHVKHGITESIWTWHLRHPELDSGSQIADQVRNDKEGLFLTEKSFGLCFHVTKHSDILWLVFDLILWKGKNFWGLWSRLWGIHPPLRYRNSMTLHFGRFTIFKGIFLLLLLSWVGAHRNFNLFVCIPTRRAGTREL